VDGWPRAVYGECCSGACHIWSSPFPFRFVVFPPSSILILQYIEQEGLGGICDTCFHQNVSVYILRIEGTIK